MFMTGVLCTVCGAQVYFLLWHSKEIYVKNTASYYHRSEIYSTALDILVYYFNSEIVLISQSSQKLFEGIRQ